MCGDECCGRVNPTNSARSFSAPAPVLNKSEVRGFFVGGGKKVLEIGAGNLRNSDYLLSFGNDVDVFELKSTVDKFRSRYDEFSRRGGRFFSQDDEEGLCENYDFVLMTYVLETICNPEVRRAVLRMACLKAGSGKLILSVRGRKDVLVAKVSGRKCSDGYHTSALTFIRGFNKNEIKGLLAEFGFNKVTFFHRRGIAPGIVHLIASE